MTAGDAPRLIEKDFPLEQVSLDSVHEKNVRHGHISTLHIYPARRPLAVCRAALIAALLLDPGTSEERREIYERLAGQVARDTDGKKVTTGGILHWKRETENADDLRWFREKIREAHGGRAPKVLDPFAGGGSIPLEAMRLGCEATAMDLNPVAWFVLKCTLEYPYLFAGKTFALPEFVRRDRDFLTDYCKARGLKGKALDRKVSEILGEGGQPSLQASGPPADDAFFETDLSWHVRAWGRWVLAEARRTLAQYYPVYAEWQPVKGWRGTPDDPPDTEQTEGVERSDGRWLRLVPLLADGTPIPDGELNAKLDPHEMADPNEPRWVTKPTVAYLWARTVRCQNPMCRATLPLLKTRWLCSKGQKRIALTLKPNQSEDGVVFGIARDPEETGGTVSRGGAECPVCGSITRTEQIRYEGRQSRLGAAMTAVVIDGPDGKEYRLPVAHELAAADVEQDALDSVFAQVPYGLPTEPTPRMGAGASRAFSVAEYGFDQWYKVFTRRQVLLLGTFVAAVRATPRRMHSNAPPERAAMSEAIAALLACAVDKMADRCSQFCRWDQGYEKIANTFTRYALPIVWDFSEGSPLFDSTGSFQSCVEWIARYLEHALAAANARPSVLALSALEAQTDGVDVVATDPPYYDAIPYSDLMDFFYVWLRRTLHGLSPEFDEVFREPLSPKWDSEKQDGELIDDSSRFGGDAAASRRAYEYGMKRAFERCRESLAVDGRMVVVFASKSPDAWEALIGALIKAGFTVTASWPVETEMGNRTVAQASAALASSIWIVCTKRPEGARPGWENDVVRGMGGRITERLREFWDAGIRGPDFVWSAFGPALEVYSRYPVVKKSGSAQGGVLSVGEFLEHARRMVVDFIVGRVFSEGRVEGADVGALDNVTAYYLLHRHDFGFETAPIGACILYATSCNLTDGYLAGPADLLERPNKKQALGEADEEDEDGEGKKKVQMVRLKQWHERAKPSLGMPEPGDARPPLVDVAHKVMQLWREGETDAVNAYIADLGLQHWSLFHQLLQALTELSAAGSDERMVLEQVMKYLKRPGQISAPSRAVTDDGGQLRLVPPGPATRRKARRGRR